MNQFWETKPLDQLSVIEWEQLCDGCARCCLHKLEDEESGELYITSIVCRYLDLDQCRCSVYAERTTKVPTCVQLTPDNLTALPWMPKSCSYRMLVEGEGLPSWHPLICGDPEQIHDAGVSVRSFAISEAELDDLDELEAFIIEQQ